MFKRLCMLSVVLLVVLLVVSCQKYDDIQRIAYITEYPHSIGSNLVSIKSRGNERSIEIYPTRYDGCIITEITVNSDGSGCEIIKNADDEITSIRDFAVNPENFKNLVDAFKDNTFFSMPIDLSTEPNFNFSEADDTIMYLEVDTKKIHYKKGGINPDDKYFVNCYEAFNKYIVDDREFLAD